MSLLLPSSFLGFLGHLTAHCSASPANDFFTPFDFLAPTCSFCTKTLVFGTHLHLQCRSYTQLTWLCLNSINQDLWTDWQEEMIINRSCVIMPLSMIVYHPYNLILWSEYAHYIRNTSLFASFLHRQIQRGSDCSAVDWGSHLKKWHSPFAWVDTKSGNHCM